MSTAPDKLAEAYFEKARNNVTWSGFPVQEFYGPGDTRCDSYAYAVGDPGQFPYTRGIHANMYRGKFWTRRELCGYGSGADTNERLRFQLREGATGLNITPDKPHFNGVDADHPLALHEAGITGVSLSSLKDMEDLLEGIPLEQVSLSLTSTTTSSVVGLAMIIVAAQKRGLDPATLRGTIQNDPIHNRYCGYGPGSPLGLSQKTSVDIIEYCTRHMPGWYTTTLNL
ncbi:MAG: acyl-CoA mutase large subunit family protein, partial [Chloroflexi bacterium]|nr:acyl-CoA mutase large subunit family protein [Chloroflexota bacterium]